MSNLYEAIWHPKTHYIVIIMDFFILWSRPKNIWVWISQTEHENDIMGFSSTKTVCELINLLSDFDSILSNYRRMGVKRQNIQYISILIYSKPGQTDRWLLVATSFWGPRSQSRAPPSPQPLEHSWQSTGPKKKKIKIPPRWPFRINQFLNGHRGGFSFFSIFRSGGLQECSPSQ